jgi:spermidine/putrescine transport system permease protein
MIVFSFNSSSSVWVFEGFSIDWYLGLLSDDVMIGALKHTLRIAILSTLISTVLGTAAAVGIMALRNKVAHRIIMGTTNIPMMNADIVTGISLMFLFVFIGKIIGLTESLGFITVLVAHITFNLPYVILSVLPKLKQTDSHLHEAALDLGCTPIKAFFKVILPSISTGIMTGMIMAFTLSLDDFLISYFVTGSGFQTLPIYIYSAVKRGVRPSLYAANTIIVLAVLVLLILINFVGDKDEKIKVRKEK